MNPFGPFLNPCTKCICKVGQDVVLFKQFEFKNSNTALEDEPTYSNKHFKQIMVKYLYKKTLDNSLLPYFFALP